PPAGRLVRPPQTIPMFFPSSRSTLSLPRRKPSPVADSTTTEINPHRMPNMVRKLRSLFARSFWTDWMMASRIAFRSPERLALRLQVVAARRALQLHVVARGGQSQHAGARGVHRAPGLRRQDDLVAWFETVENLNLRAVADADLHRHLLLAVFRARRDDVDERILPGVVGDRGLRYDERIRVLLENDFGVGRHVRLERLPRVVDRD